MFFVQLTPPGCADVGLVAGEFAIAGVAAELHATVTLVVNQFDVEGQFEIAHREVADEPFVAFQPSGPADNFSVFD